MPFYRSNFGSSGGGGGGGGSTDSSHIIVTTTGNTPYMERVTLNAYATPTEDMNAITKIEIGNKVLSANYLASGGNANGFNAAIDLTNATALNDIGYAFADCINFNSPVAFPERFDCVESVISYGSLLADYSYMFSNCEKYDQPTTIRLHDYASDNEYSSSVALYSLFGNCFNFNSRVIFDFNKVHRNVNGEQDAYLHSVGYQCSSMFYNCKNFNQPLVFPPLISGVSNYMFVNCNNFNQPIVFDLYGVDSYTSVNFYCLFNKLPNMSSDIILLNSNREYNKFCFTHMFNSSRNHMTNIYIENITNIINDQIITGGPNNISGYTVSASPYNSACNVYTNTAFNITISEDVEYGLSEFNNYYYNLYGEYPVIMNLLNY